MLVALVGLGSAVIAFATGLLLARALAARRLDALVRAIDAELEPLVERLQRAAARADLARRASAAEPELRLGFPELERDELTGVRNRVGYEADLDREIELARRTGRPLSVLLLDVPTGAGPEHEQLLRDLAALLQRLTRSSDTVFRRSDAELGILLPETPAEGARRFHGRVLEEVARAPFARSRPMTFAVGLAQWRPNETGESFDARASATVGPFEPPIAFRPPQTR